MDMNSPSAQYCCPDPSNSVIPEDSDTKVCRMKMKWLYYGQIPKMILWALLTAQPFSIINGLLLMWMIYMSYATMHFCQTMFVAVIFTMDFLGVFSKTLIAGSIFPIPFVLIMWMIVIFDGIGCFWSW